MGLTDRTHYADSGQNTKRRLASKELCIHDLDILSYNTEVDPIPQKNKRTPGASVVPGVDGQAIILRMYHREWSGRRDKTGASLWLRTLSVLCSPGSQHQNIYPIWINVQRLWIRDHQLWIRDQELWIRALYIHQELWIRDHQLWIRDQELCENGYTLTQAEATITPTSTWWDWKGRSQLWWTRTKCSLT